MFRIVKLILFVAVLGAAYGLYHLNADKQRDQEALAWSNRLIWDALGGEQTPRFGGQTVAQGPTDKSWRITGQLAARGPAGSPIEGAYQAVVAQSCSPAGDERCWELQALRVGNDVILAGDGLLDAQLAPAPSPEPAAAQTAAAPAKAPAAQADATPGDPPASSGSGSQPAEKAVIFALPPPDIADSSLGFDPVEPDEEAARVGSAREAAAQLAMQLSPRRPAAPAIPEAQGDNDLPEPEMEAVPVAPVELAAELEATTAPAAGAPESPALAAPETAEAAPASIEPAPTAPAPAAAPQTAALPQPEAVAEQAERFDPGLLRDTQDRLLRLDYGRGALTRSGAYDAATQAAIEAYQAKNGLSPNGRPSRALLAHMDSFLARLDALASGKAAPKPVATLAAPQPAAAAASGPAPVIGGYANFRKGLAAEGRGQIDQAIAHYTRAIESTQWRERHMAYLSRGKVLAGQGRYRQAINDYSTAIDLRPDYAEAWINRGLAFAQLAQREQAMADLRQGQRLAPGSSAAAQALRTLESRSELQ